MASVRAILWPLWWPRRFLLLSRWPPSAGPRAKSHESARLNYFERNDRRRFSTLILRGRSDAGQANSHFEFHLAGKIGGADRLFSQFRASDVSSGWEKPLQGAPAKRSRISPTRILENRLLSSGSACVGRRIALGVAAGGFGRLRVRRLIP